MEKKNSLQIQIPEPCNKSWSDMKPDGSGRFCMSCSKTVLDFSTYSDEQLIGFFTTRKSGEVCGRFSNQQLYRPITTSRPFRKWLRALASFILPFLISCRAESQRTDTVGTPVPRPIEKIRTEDHPVTLGIVIPPDWIERQKPEDLRKKEVNPRHTVIRRVRGKVALNPKGRTKD